MNTPSTFIPDEQGMTSPSTFIPDTPKSFQPDGGVLNQNETINPMMQYKPNQVQPNSYGDAVAMGMVKPGGLVGTSASEVLGVPGKFADYLATGLLNATAEKSHPDTIEQQAAYEQAGGQHRSLRNFLQKAIFGPSNLGVLGEDPNTKPFHQGYSMLPESTRDVGAFNANSSARKMFEGLTTPGNVAMLPLMATKAGPAMGGLFGAQTAVDLPNMSKEEVAQNALMMAVPMLLHEGLSSLKEPISRSAPMVKESLPDINPEQQPFNEIKQPLSTTEDLPTGVQQDKNVRENTASTLVGKQPPLAVNKVNPDWRVTVQGEQTMPDGVTKVPGYVQVDDVSGGENNWSKSPETLKKEGVELPDLSKLAPGKYSMGDALKQVGNEGMSAESGSVGLHLLDPDVWKELGFKAKVSGEQLINRLRNKLGGDSGQFKIIDTPEFREFLKEPRTVQEAEKFVNEKGPKVEVRKFGQGSMSTKQREYNNLQHWRDTLNSSQRRKLDEIMDPIFGENPEKVDSAFKQAGFTDEGIKNAKRYNTLVRDPEAKSTENRSNWQSIAPKSEKDMPGYTEIAVVKPIGMITTKQQISKYGKPITSDNQPAYEDAQFSSSHNFPPNTLGFVRGYMETTAQGKKVFHVIEVQSDWAQQHRYFNEAGSRGNRELVQAEKDKVNSLHDPLLSHYERLALKAAIDHAREQGADAIAISDAETAMMTEGHDRGQTGVWSLYDKDGNRISGHDTKQEAIDELQYNTIHGNPDGLRVEPTKLEDRTPTQSEGMRLHYDKTLPKIAEELTGEKGMKESFGEHRMAMESAYGGVLHPQEPITTRKDLIFRNEKGEPKTDVSARVYSINKSAKDFSVVGKDKPKQPLIGNEKVSNESGFISLPDLKKARDKFANAIKSISTRQDITRFKEAADNEAVITAQRAKKGLEGIAKNLFGKQSQDALDATTVAIEANGDKSKVQKFIQQAQVRNDERGLKAAQFADANWDKLQPLVNRANILHEGQLNEELAHNIPTDAREGYVRHSYDIEKLPGQLADKYFSSGNGTGGTGFLKGRTFPTYFDAIEHGYGNAIRSWNAADLVENRIRSGQQKVNDIQWLEGMKGLKEPASGKSIVTDLIRKQKPTGVDLVAPPGYEKWSPFPGQSFAVHRGYVKLLNNITATSAIRDFELGGFPVGEALLKGVGKLKHSMLMYDTYHAMRMSAKGVSLKGSASFGKGVSLLEYGDADLATAVKNRDITQAMANYAQTKRPIGEFLIRQGLNVGRVQESLASAGDNSPIGGLLGPSNANKWIFEKLTRGIMMESAISEFERVKKQGEITDVQAARKVVRDINTYFGNLGRQGVFKSRTFQDLSRLFFLAPQWFESMAKTELGSTMQGVKALGTGNVGTLAKGTGTLLVAMLAATQMANMFFQGKPSWKNEEGHKWDAKIPGGENGMWVSPLSMPMELTHDLIRYKGEGENNRQAMMHILKNKYAPLFRAEETVRTGRDYADRKLSEKEVVKTAAQNVLPIPLPAQAALNPKASLERQLLASAGVKAEPAKGPVQRVQAMARKWTKANGVEDLGEYPQSQYYDLNVALRKNDATKAREAMKALRDGGKKDEVIKQYYDGFARQEYTGSKEHEKKFVASLNEEEKGVYEQATLQNEKVRENFYNIFMNRPAPRLPREAREGREKRPRQVFPN